MFDFYPLNETRESSSLKAKRFINNGLVKVSSFADINKNQIVTETRNELEKAFQKKRFPRQIDLHHIRNQDIQELVLNLFSSKEVKNLFKELSQKSGSEVTLFPFIDVMRNYFSGPQCGFPGWHNDAGGELPYYFCREKMRTGKYLFGKLSISFQPNGIYGGNIDIAKATYKKYEKKSLRQMISNISIKTFFKIYKRSPSFRLLGKDQWVSDYLSIITNPKTVSPDPLDVIAFEHRLYHRGTPASPNGWKELKKRIPTLSIENFKIPGDINLDEKNKYIIYAHFGNIFGLQSYIYDRSRRDLWKQEKKRWLEQYKFLELFKSEFQNSSVFFQKVLEIKGIELNNNFRD